jgi:hypothetical protein
LPPNIHKSVAFLNVPSLRPVCPSVKLPLKMKKNMKHSWDDTEKGEIEVPGEKPFRLPHCGTKISRILACDRTRASTVKSRQLTSWSAAQRLCCIFIWFCPVREVR